jgi:hypothetical protein
MTTLILTPQRDGGYVTPRHSRAHEHLVARLRAWALDKALAHGACPDSTPALSLRAHRLIGQATRRELSQAIHRVLREARSPGHPGNPGIPICRRKVMQAKPALEELAERLVNSGPVDARGVARVQLLLKDGSSPLYDRPHADDLEPALSVAIDALEFRP